MGLECAGACFSDGGVVPEMVWVGSFSNTHIGPYPESLGEGSAFEKAFGDIPGSCWWRTPFLKDSHAQAIRRITKLFIFPPMIKGEAGRRVNPATPLEKVLGPHTHLTAVSLLRGFSVSTEQRFTFQGPPPPRHYVMLLLGRTDHTCQSAAPMSLELGTLYLMGKKKGAIVTIYTIRAKTGISLAFGLLPPEKMSFFPWSLAMPSPQAEKDGKIDLCIKK